MSFLKRIIRKNIHTTQCNYSNNYYGDQVCTPTRNK